jgi:D-3-phosphoglycerate dehydrogenase
MVNPVSGTPKAPQVLVTEELAPAALRLLQGRGLGVSVATGLDPRALRERIGGFEGLIVRSATRVGPALLSAATHLRVIGRAGGSVEHIDVPAATARGVAVMNAPFGNAITTAEHAIALMFALARRIAAADAALRAGSAPRERFEGIELAGKTLGIVGCGNIGAIVADRALGLRMQVIAADPFLSAERAQALGVEKVTLAQLLARADLISLHTPLSEQTRHLIDAAALAKCKPGVRIINCARAGLVDEVALLGALQSGRVAGAALDALETEITPGHPLLALDSVVFTPRLGSATREAREHAAVQVAGQVADFLLSGIVRNALNVPAVAADELPRLRPYLALADQLGSLAAQVVDGALEAVDLGLEGRAAGLPVRPVFNSALAALLRPVLDAVNDVNAPVLAGERGIRLVESRCESAAGHAAGMRLTVQTSQGRVVLAGTLFNGMPRLVGIDGVDMECELTARMLLVRNRDTPGFVGRLGTTLGNAGVNIGNLHLGRRRPGADQVCLVSVDADLPANVLAALRALPGILAVHPLRFDPQRDASMRGEAPQGLVRKAG